MKGGAAKCIPLPGNWKLCSSLSLWSNKEARSTNEEIVKCQNRRRKAQFFLCVQRIANETPKELELLGEMHANNV